MMSRIYHPLAVFVALLVVAGCGTNPPDEEVDRYSNLGVSVECVSCPRIEPDYPSRELVVHDAQEHEFSGWVDARGPVHGLWRVYDGDDNRYGPIHVWGDGGFSEQVPLFCGENLLEAIFSSHDGVSVWRQLVIAEDCPGMPNLGCGEY